MHFMIPDESEFTQDYSKKFGVDMDKNDYQIDLIEDKTWNHYSFDGDATNEDEITKFVQDFLDGKVKKQVKSQPIPNPSHEENVKILVGKTHNKQVYSETENFVMYYAPWCGHCKSFKPTLEQFATHVKDTNIIVAKIDMTENEAEGTSIKGYPTIYWYPKDPKAERIKFDDNRSLDGVKQFVLKHSVDYKNHFPNEKLKQSADSQDIPQKDDDAVKVLVGLNHDEIVKSADNDALVMYYAPWCGHCKNLAPKWLELAEHVKGSNVVIAKIDMTENKIKGLNVTGYPTLNYYEADKPMISYEGGREL
jgi:protein disulfide-isomerase-like protein